MGITGGHFRGCLPYLARLSILDKDWHIPYCKKVLVSSLTMVEGKCSEMVGKGELNFLCEMLARLLEESKIGAKSQVDLKKGIPGSQEGLNKWSVVWTSTKITWRACLNADSWSPLPEFLFSKWLGQGQADHFHCRPRWCPRSRDHTLRNAEQRLRNGAYLEGDK